MKKVLAVILSIIIAVTVVYFLFIMQRIAKAIGQENWSNLATKVLYLKRGKVK